MRAILIYLILEAIELACISAFFAMILVFAIAIGG